MSAAPARMLVALCALSLLATTVGTAYAQVLREDDPKVIEQKQKKKDAEEIDRRYRATLKGTDAAKPVAPAQNDPWQNMRAPNDANARR